jgi:hypothetical protein
LRFGYSAHSCRSCYNCNSKYCYLGKRWTFFIACKLWFDKNLREGNPVAINLLKNLNKEKERSKEFRRLWHVWMKIVNDKTNEIYELMKK